MRKKKERLTGVENSPSKRTQHNSAFVFVGKMLNRY